MAVFPDLSVLAKGTTARGNCRVVRYQCPRVPEGAEILGRVETEGPSDAGRAGPVTVPPGSVRLACVLDQRDFRGLGDFHELPHVRELAVEMLGQNEARARRDGVGGR